MIDVIVVMGVGVLIGAFGVIAWKMLSGKTGWYATMQRTFQTQPAVILSEIRLLISQMLI